VVARCAARRRPGNLGRGSTARRFRSAAAAATGPAALSVTVAWSSNCPRRGACGMTHARRRRHQGVVHWLADLLDVAVVHGLAAAAGAVPSVGMTGMAMVGGYGGLIARFGLTLDKLLSAEWCSPTRLRWSPGLRITRIFWWRCAQRRPLRGGDFGPLPAVSSSLSRYSPATRGHRVGTRRAHRHGRLPD
jgi:hypothetical protein